MRTARVTSRGARQRRPEEHGAVALEFALVLPLLAMLLMGIVTGGVSYSHALGVANAVREGARFGATADGTSSSWAADTVARVRATQFDDTNSAATSSTSVCAALVRAPSTVITSTCSVGGAGGPRLSMPAVTASPAVPTVTSGACVVRVVAARNFTINVALTSFSGTITRGSVARYENSSC